MTESKTPPKKFFQGRKLPVNRSRHHRYNLLADSGLRCLQRDDTSLKNFEPYLVAPKRQSLEAA
jgi:hypothetical protein